MHIGFTLVVCIALGLYALAGVIFTTRHRHSGHTEEQEERWGSDAPHGNKALSR
jgi:hypothetical protein